MNCAYCNGPCDDRPIRHLAVCWGCHLKDELEAKRKDAGFMARLKASLKRNRPILEGLRRSDVGNGADA